jgi:hypothetical protein
MHSMASGKHEVTYAIGCDSDDPVTVATAWALRVEGYPVRHHCSVRLASLGAIDNAVAAAFPADAYCALCDDVEILTPHWDDRIHDAWSARPDGVWWWRTTNIIPCAIISEKWRAAAGYVFTDYFPFWWDDIWLLQLWKYASGEPNLVVQAYIKDCGPRTQRMRDLRFWTDFFWSAPMRQKRIDEAAGIGRALGWPPVADLASHEVQRNTSMNPEAIEAAQGERSPPTPEYLAAKARAERLMEVP